MAKSRAAVAGRDAIEVKHETLPANRVRLLDRTSALHSTGRAKDNAPEGGSNCAASARPT